MSVTGQERPIQVLIVDPNPACAAVHGEYVQRTSGFAVSAVAATGAEALRQVERQHPDLLLLELDLAGNGGGCDVESGLEFCRRLRRRHHDVDVMVVTALREPELVRATVRLGVVGHLLKPAPQRTFQACLRRYGAYHRRTAGTGPISQEDVDAALAQLRPGPRTESPLRAPVSGTLEAVSAYLREAPGPVAAHQVAEALGVSRVTARRYLEELATRRLTVRSQRYGRSGRPRHLYRWCSDPVEPGTAERRPGGS